MPPAALAHLVVGPAANVLWVLMGRGIRRLLERLRAFNLAMALLLLASLRPVLAT